MEITRHFDGNKFDIETFKSLTEMGWRDTSWGNDFCPSLEIGSEDADGIGTHRIWVAERLESDREGGAEIDQFLMCEIATGETLFASEVPAEIIKAAKEMS
jgi:hypothetical protein